MRIKWNPSKSSYRIAFSPTPSNSQVFGRLADGREVRSCELTGEAIRAVVFTYGAILARLEVPDRAGEFRNVVLGHPDLEGYSSGKGYFGATIGRFANRISGGRFSIDAHDFHVTCNDGPNALHGGVSGFDRAVWTIGDITGNSVLLQHVSPDGDQGFPGTLAVEVRYSLSAVDLRIDYRATTDAPTVINLTNHSYFNLCGEGAGDVLDHELLLRSSFITPVDKTMIPTGELRAVDDTPFDFRMARRVGSRIREPDPQLRFGRGYDMNWALDARNHPLQNSAGWLYEPRCGRFMEFFTTEPGVQVYSANLLDGSQSGTSGRAYRQSDGLTFETQHYPDSPNRPEFPSTVLRPGETFESTTIYRFSAR